MIRHAALLSLFLSSPALAEPWGHWDPPTAPPTSTNTEPELASMPMMGMLRGYQLLLSPLDVAECPMYPSCSRFAMEAYARFGPLQGTLMTASRLARETHDVAPDAPILRRAGRTLLLDLPEDRRLW